MDTLARDTRTLLRDLVTIDSVNPCLDADLEADAAIVTEPAEMAIGIAHKGFVWTEIEVIGMSYWADLAFISASGIPTVLFGPRGEGAHADTEWVSLTDTADCALILLAAARTMGDGGIVA